MRFFKGFVQICMGAVLLVLMGTYLGALHPLGDSLAIGRLALAGVLAALALVALSARMPRWSLVGAVAAVLSGGPILWSFAIPARPLASGAPTTVTIYVKNLLNNWGDMDAIASDIRGQGAGVVLLQEATIDRGADLVADLATDYPHRHVCQFSGWSGIVVLSQWPLSEPYCSPHRSIAAARVAHPDGPIWAASVHLVWPYPHGQAEVVDLALPFLSEFEGRVVVAGDFNMVPWGASVRQIAKATGTARVGRLFNTLEVNDIPLQIDHVLTNGRGTTALRPRLGSDHYGLIAHIGWP